MPLIKKTVILRWNGEEKGTTVLLAKSKTDKALKALHLAFLSTFPGLASDDLGTLDRAAFYMRSAVEDTNRSVLVTHPAAQLISGCIISIARPPPASARGAGNDDVDSTASGRTIRIKHKVRKAKPPAADQQQPAAADSHSNTGMSSSNINAETTTTKELLAAKKKKTARSGSTADLLKDLRLSSAVSLDQLEQKQQHESRNGDAFPGTSKVQPPSSSSSSVNKSIATDGRRGLGGQRGPSKRSKRRPATGEDGRLEANGPSTTDPSSKSTAATTTTTATAAAAAAATIATTVSNGKATKKRSGGDGNDGDKKDAAGDQAVEHGQVDDEAKLHHHNHHHHHQHMSQMPALDESTAVSLAEPKPSLHEEVYHDIATGNIDSAHVKRWALPVDKLQINEQVGKGHFSQVAKGRYQGKPVAVKMVNVVSAKSQEMFLHEAGLLAMIPDHANVVRCVGICSDPGEHQWYLVTEFAGLGSLNKWLRLQQHPQQRGVTQGEKLQFAVDCAAGLAHLHRYDVIHRDLSARNLLLTSHRRVKVSDLGLSRFTRARMPAPKIKARPVRWMAPEALRGGKYSFKSDIWALGVTLWEIAANGLIPYGRGVKHSAVIDGVCTGRMRLSRPQSCDPVMGDVMRACWHHNRDDRPSAVDCLAQLQTGLQNMSHRDANKIVSPRAGPGGPAGMFPLPMEMMDGQGLGPREDPRFYNPGGGGPGGKIGKMLPGPQKVLRPF